MYMIVSSTTMMVMMVELYKTYRQKTKEQVHLVLKRQFIYYSIVTYFVYPFITFKLINYFESGIIHKNPMHKSHYDQFR